MRAKSFLLSLFLGCLSALNLSSMAQVKPRENTQPQQPQTKPTPGEAGPVQEENGTAPALPPQRYRHAVDDLRAPILEDQA